MNAVPQHLPPSTTDATEALTIVAPLPGSAAELATLQQALESTLDSVYPNTRIIYTDSSSPCSDYRSPASLPNRNTRFDIVSRGQTSHLQLNDMVLLINRVSLPAISRIPEILAAWRAGFDMVTVTGETSRRAQLSDCMITGTFLEIIGKRHLSRRICDTTSMRLLAYRALSALTDVSTCACAIEELLSDQSSTGSMQQHVAGANGVRILSLNSVELPQQEEYMLSLQSCISL